MKEKVVHCWHMLPEGGGFIKAQDRCCYCNIPKNEKVRDKNHGDYADFLDVCHDGEICVERTKRMMAHLASIGQLDATLDATGSK